MAQRHSPATVLTLPLVTRLAAWAVGALVVAVPLVMAPSARDSFRLPKLLTAEWLGLLSVLLLAWRARGAQPGAWRRLLGTPVWQAVAPLVAVATLSLATSDHHEHVRRALPSLWIGATCLVGWANGFDRDTLARLVRLGVLPAALLALLGALQFHGLFRPFAFIDPIASSRLGVTSLAGNAGDLGSFLLLPCLLAQERVWRERGRVRMLWAGALVLCLYGLAVSQSLTALAALAVGTALLWALLLPRRRASLLLASGLAVAALAIAAVGPLRVRVAQKLENLVRGDFDALLTYRLDGWAAAGWMLRQHPFTGVGHGAFVAEFTTAKLALLERGRAFPDRGNSDTTFSNAHNDVLEVGAELGWPGLLAVVWGVATLGVVAWRHLEPGRVAPDRVTDRVASDAALGRAGLVAIGVVVLGGFPFETALVAYSWLVFLAWILCPRSAPALLVAPAPARPRTPKRERR